MALVEIAAFADPTLAEIVRARLAAEGMEAVILDGGMSSIGLGHMTPARLLVDDACRAEAERLIAIG